MASVIAEQYEEQRQLAAESLIDVQNPNKGWGLRPEAPSSIVNTAEVLNVLKAAGMADGPEAAGAANYLVQALFLHFQALSEDVAEVGRGLNLRYLTFGIDGLVTVPEVAFSTDGQAALRFCIDWLARVQLESGGIPAKVGGDLASYHAVARTLISLSKLLVDPSAPGDLAEHLTAARRIADRAANFVKQQMGNSGFLLKAYPGSHGEFSPVKTAIATTALGYYRLLNDDPEISTRQQKAAGWLLANKTKWRKAMTQDPQESSSSWEHCDYAEVPRAIATSRPQAWGELKSSWTLMLEQWSPEADLWGEPRQEQGNPTIRAAYHTVMAFEPALPTSRVVLPPKAGGELFGDLISVQRDGVKFRLQGTENATTFDLSKRLKVQLVFETIVDAGDAGVTAEKLSEVAGLQRRGIATYVDRINKAAALRTGGGLNELVESVPAEGRGSVYKIATRRDGA